MANTKVSPFACFLLVLLAVSNAAVVLLGRATTSKTFVANGDHFSIGHMIIVTECLKFLVAALLEEHHSYWGLKISIKKHIIENPRDAKKMAIPAFLYFAETSLIFAGLSNLSIPTFQVAFQSKILMTALLSVVMLQRKYTSVQWTCLVTLVFGISLAIAAELFRSGTPDGHWHGFLYGIANVLLAGLAMSFATVYFEKVVKESSNEDEEASPMMLETSQENNLPPASLWMRTMQLSFFSILVAIGRDMFEGSEDNNKSFFHGFTVWVWILTILNALMGVLVAAVIKYADSVLKALATSLSVILSTLLSAVFFGTRLTPTFLFGMLLVVGSVLGFSLHIDGASSRPLWEILMSSPIFGGRSWSSMGERGSQNAEDSLAAPLLVI
ncbi:UDP-galactose translocator [Seminavis robusta]|uniref:UDP-galactose translocator n=1 Tax=Seminavis robusta TaxID=568900 RepID=A0A9N8H7I3_9STRA|nr:UDP-galactose translocator [Seminavis robusta]|eukprot:Sro130_g061860.1 UDP-galactose translocator (384) ;mRNA; r:39118-40342